jgi:Tol biopolymer transport system component
MHPQDQMAPPSITTVEPEIDIMTRLTALSIVALLTLSACTDSGRLLRPSAEPRLDASLGFGSKIAFTSDRDDPGVSTEVYVVNADGSSERQLTSTAGNSNGPAWSPNGRMISFHSNRGGGGFGGSDIYVVMSDDTSDVRRLTNLTDAGLGGAHFANWSPNGRQVVFNSFWGGLLKRDIYVIDLDGTGLTKLTQDPAGPAIDDVRPDWSPDGRRIAFQSNRSGNYDIWLMDADGSNLQQLTFNSATDAAPEWSPNGMQIAFQSNRAGNDDIWVIDADGGGLLQLTTFAGRDAKPSWSPDGRRISFHRDVLAFGEVHGELFTMNADGSDAQMLSVPRAKAFNGFPSWGQGHDAVP